MDENLKAFQDDLYRWLQLNARYFPPEWGEGFAEERNKQIHALTYKLTLLIDGGYVLLKREVRNQVERSRWGGKDVMTPIEARERGFSNWHKFQRAPERFQPQYRRPAHCIPRPTRREEE